MFAGHYTSAFVAKRAVPRAPLWALLLAAQFVDVLWVMAIMTGIEHVRLDPALASNPLDLYDMPWTHSLAASVVWAGVAFAGARRLFGFSTGASAAVAAVTLSHWFLDLVVHRPDLTIAGGTEKLGLGLWNYPFVAWLLEVVLVIASVRYAVGSWPDSRAKNRCIALGALLVVLQTATSFGPLPGSVGAMAMSTLIIYVLITFAGRWVERPREA